MAYRRPRFMYDHALRDAAAGSVTITTPDSVFDEHRLYDGLIRPARSYEWGQALANHAVEVDLGAGIPTYDRLIIPAGHNLTGASYVVEDDDNSGFTSATSLASSSFPAGTALLDIPFTASAQRYLRLRITSSGDWRMSEVYFTKVVTTDATIGRGPDPGWTDQPVTNVNLTRMRSGEGYALELGPIQQHIVYEFHKITAADRAMFEALLAATSSGTQPFYLDRTDDALPPIYVRLVEQITMVQDRKDPKALGPSYTVRVAMSEEIA